MGNQTDGSRFCSTLIQVAHFASHAADRRVPKFVDQMGSVRSMRGWVATATLVPYIASVVEVAFGGVGGAASDFGLVGGGELRRDGSDWTWLCHSVGLWPMANSKGRWCGCMDPDQGFAWAWAIIALALFGMGGDGPCRPGLSDKDGGESPKESKKPKSGKFWRYFSWSAWVESALSRPSSKATKGKSGKESAGEGSMPAAPSEIQPAVDDRDERVSGSTKVTGQKNLPGGSHDVRVGLLQKLRSEEEMVRTGGNSSTADLQRLLRDAETRGSASGVWVSRGEAESKPKDDESDIRIIARSINYAFVTTFTKVASLARRKSLKKSPSTTPALAARRGRRTNPRSS